MKKLISGLLAIWALVALALAAEAPFKDNIPDRYTVKEGDTLWDISDYFLSKPWVWPEIWHVNPQIRNPHLIYPGDVINLVYIDGKPRLTLSRGRDVKLSPQIRSIENRQAIPPLPLEMINSFLTRSRVVDKGVLEAAPYVLAGQEKHILAGLNDDFYARGNLDPNLSVYGVYRDGGNYVDPASGELLGVRAQAIGSAKLKVMDKDVATLGVTRSEEEIRAYDRLLPDEAREIDTTFQPSAPPDGSDGLIVSVEGSVRVAGLLDVVAINLGDRSGIKTGNMLAIYKKGEVVKDRVTGGHVQLPAERAGLLMVFRTFEKMSYGLILNANRPLAVGDAVKSP